MAQRHSSALSPTPQVVGMVQKNSENGTPGAGGAVPDGLPSRYGTPSLSESLFPGTMAQMGSLYDPRVPLQRHPEGTLPVSQAAHASPIASPRYADRGGLYFCGAPPRSAKTDAPRGKMQRMDLGGNMDSCRHNILRAPGTRVVPASPLLPGAQYQGDSPGGLSSTGGDIQNGTDIETLLASDPPLVKEAWPRIKGR